MKNIILDTTHIKKLSTHLYDYTTPTPLMRPKLISINKIFAKELGFDDIDLESNHFIEFINGSYILKGSIPYANAYAGHQFGYCVPQLGDGRAICLGKLKTHHLQLKGSGLTKYSRDGDGRAVLRSTIREYLASEAMDALGIPTTKALAMITSDTKVYRNYDVENGAIVLRTADTWTRFGSFEFAYQNKDKEKNLKSIADMLILENYPHLKDNFNKYEELYFEIVDKTIELIALWQSVGFMHGVMNTDNMSASGLTIDYGPYAFMEEFDSKFVCNLSDHEGRYSFENQPFIAQWNLSVLAKVLSPIASSELMNSYNDTFIGKYKKRYFQIIKNKLGLYDTSIDDTSLILRMFSALQAEKIDYSSFFYNLSSGDYSFINTHQLKFWLKMYKKRLENETVSKEYRVQSMKKINPKYILRNYMLQDAIDKAEQGDYTLVNDLLHIAQNPFDEHLKYEHYTKPNQDFKAMKCSCSS
ncbi:MAG: YdiU family protein [Campylobacterota bacterium]|nr:YdiU family protein [Campylobacterota bacterium]